MEHITYKTQGVCSRQIDIDIENGVIVKTAFMGGCSGNTQGVSALIVGMTVEEAINLQNAEVEKIPNGKIILDLNLSHLNMYISPFSLKKHSAYKQQKHSCLYLELMD